MGYETYNEELRIKPLATPKARCAREYGNIYGINSWHGKHQQGYAAHCIKAPLSNLPKIDVQQREEVAKMKHRFLITEGNQH